MTQKTLFPRSIRETKLAHVYDNRQSLVTDIWQGVSALLKEKKELIKANGKVYSTKYCHSFEVIQQDKDGSWYIAEEWDINLSLMEDIEVYKCVQRDYEHKTKTSYFGEELKKSQSDRDYNRIENITAFREFLQRECLGIGKADKP